MRSQWIAVKVDLHATETEPGLDGRRPTPAHPVTWATLAGVVLVTYNGERYAFFPGVDVDTPDMHDLKENLAGLWADKFGHLRLADDYKRITGQAL